VLLEANAGLDGRVRVCETQNAALEARLNTLMDHEGNPGLISKMESRILEKLNEFGNKVTDFINGESVRHTRYDKGWQDAFSNQQAGYERDKREHLEMHNKNEQRLDNIVAVQQRHEKLFQRGFGALLLINGFILVMGFVMSALTFLGALIWFLVRNLPKGILQ